MGVMVRTDSEAIHLSSVEAWIQARLAVPRLAPSLRTVLEELDRLLLQERSRERVCFLSVVIRTQCRRWEQLQDAILCLAAQTDQDFEIVVMLHDVDELRAEQLRNFLQSYPEEFHRRIKMRHVSGGGRSRPLLESIALIEGEYVAFFDDDDLLMANWVEAFRSTATSAPGRVLRANVAIQLNRMEQWGSSAAGQRTVGAASAEYMDHFQLLDHFKVNHTPFMGVAFPVTFFSFWGESFDESLLVCEDWDILMRAAGLLGVESSSEMTAVYRQWENTQTSYTSHALEEWQEAEAKIQRKIDAVPSFLPEGSVGDILEVLEREHARAKVLGERLHEVTQSTSWRLTRPLRRMTRLIRRQIRRWAG